MVKKIISFVLILTLGFGVSVKEVFAENTANIGSYDLESIMKGEAQWLKEIQLPNGVIPMNKLATDNKYKVIPYFSNIALLGILEVPGYEEVVKKYLDWYISHLNANDYNGLTGTVYDYYYKITDNGLVEISTNDYDSTDSYAATFLSLVRKYYEKTGDIDYLNSHKEQIETIAQVIISTLDSDGLTWAKPNYKVKYLMDNSEVRKGLEDAVWLFREVYKDEEKATMYSSYLKKVDKGIESLWDEELGIYHAYKDEKGNLGATNMQTFYPDATAQLFPIWTGHISPSSERALTLYNKFNHYHSGWPVLNTTDEYPWAMIAYTAAILGDKTRVEIFLDAVKKKYIDTGRNNPTWYCMESGLTILAAKIISNIPSVEKSISILSPQNQETIENLPFNIIGKSSGGDKVELEIVRDIDRETETVELQVYQDGNWEYKINDLLNNSYTIIAKLKDKFDNIYEATSIKINVKVDYGKMPDIKNVVLESNKKVLKRWDTAQLSLKIVFVDGEEVINLDASNMDIKYVCDKPDMVMLTSSGRLTLIKLDKEVNMIKVWAYLTFNHSRLKSDILNIEISQEPPSFYDKIIDLQTDYIDKYILPNGAIATQIEKTNDATNFIIDPYKANIIAMALLERPEYIEKVKAYVKWYINHFNWPDSDGLYGTVDKYWFDPNTGKEKSIGKSDSPAATSATFISLMKKYYEVTGDSQFLITYKYQIDVIGGIIIQTIDTKTTPYSKLVKKDDGLVWTNLVQRVKDIKTNSEALRGLEDIVWLFEKVYKDKNGADFYNVFYDLVKNSIEEHFWDSKSNTYIVLMDEDGKVQESNESWKILFPILTKVVPADSNRAKEIYKKLNEEYPLWFQNIFTDFSGYMGYVSSIMKDKQKLDSYLNYVDKNYPYGTLWNSYLAALVILSSANGKNISNIEEPQPTPSPELQPTPSPEPKTSSETKGVEVSQGKVIESADKAVLVVDEIKVSKDIKDSTRKKVQFDLTNISTKSVKALEIPVSVLNLIAENKKDVIVKSDEIALKFESKVLAVSKEVLDLINKEGSITLTIEKKSKPDANAYKPVSNAYDITIKAGESKIKLESPVKLTFEVKDAKDIRKVGVYYLNEAIGKWEYVGGKVDKNTNTVTAEVKHFSTYGAFEYDKQFKDVPKDLWAYDVINVLASKHIIKGMDDDNFAPNAKITRAEFAALMIRALGIPEEPYKGEFEDVKAGAWYANAIEAAYRAGIMMGDGKKMRPDDPITREEMAAVIMRVYAKMTGYKEENIGNTVFKDNDSISEWARNVVANAAKLGIVKGYEDNTFRAKNNATRAEGVTLLYRILEKLQVL
ncbi:MAG: S-layer-like proteiny domain protein [Caldanaerobacter subterraneus]|uniref:SLH domain-containing protein n=1 Tax=Caldanaerobacter subterraneus TaxID=911092 RepID=A0A101E5H2_9THEO|nr:MAG: S-layer-like proteiny domain protein [Caldanaerobacter subterraneus]HBT48871.1 hypothetical protein [Caldanaerobacter subterraneus]